MNKYIFDVYHGKHWVTMIIVTEALDEDMAKEQAANELVRQCEFKLLKTEVI